jgi:NADH-quinone oxidoreductase subunit F
MTFEDLRAAGLPLGSGVVMVFDETRDMRDVLKRLGNSSRMNPAANAIPARWEPNAKWKSLTALPMAKRRKVTLIRLQDVGWTMTDASICGLGQTAASAALSAMKLWPELFKKEERGRQTQRQSCDETSKVVNS